MFFDFSGIVPRWAALLVIEPYLLCVAITIVYVIARKR